uniref:SAM domain-containing protein n=1 Tax=Tetraodon nigroviridis TaxID=99883 RepID=H3DBR1_TETNG
MDGEKQEDSRRAATASSFASAAVTTATVCPGSSAGTRAPSGSLGIVSPDRTAVQVIQHAFQRPQSLAAQLLQQMYAAQQQHLMLQTAAHRPHLQSLATMHQASACQRQSTSSPSNGSIHPPAGVSTQVSLPASPVTAQLVGRTQNSISSGVSTTISQQAVLLGGRPDCNQAQMYLRTQMLILTPAASVAPVQSDLPAVTSCSSASNASQVQGLVLHHLPGALATALTPAAPKSPGDSLMSSQVSESSSERGQPEVAGSQVLTPDKKTRVPLPRADAAEAAALLSARPPGGALPARPPADHRRQPRSAPPQDTSSCPPPFLSKSRSSPGASASSSLTSASSANVQPQPPPQRRSSVPQVHLVLPGLPQDPPAAPQRPSLPSVQASAVGSQQAVLEERAPSTGGALRPAPHQSRPPPQTAAVDLKVQPAPGTRTPPTDWAGVLKSDRSPHLSTGSSPPSSGSLKLNAGGDASLEITGATLLAPVVSRDSPGPAAADSSSSLPAAVRCPSYPPSSPSGPHGALPTHVLTHLIEGFVIQEGLEPFPVVPSTLLKTKQASLPDSQEMKTNQDAARAESPLEANQSDSSDFELRCQYCGARGHACISVRSKRFCSMTCVRSSSVVCVSVCLLWFNKHITLLRAGRWGHRAAGRRGRPPSSVNGHPRELRLPGLSLTGGHVLQVHRPPRSRECGEEEEEEEACAPARLRKRVTTETISISDEAEEDRRPSLWDVERVFSYISSLPGGEDVAPAFRSQEIDGQALLLLTEDHLVGAMNLKLGPALKLYAHINSLKG